MDSDEAFEEFIVEDSDSGKENILPKKRKHITNDQYNLINSFVQSDYFLYIKTHF